MNITFRPLSPFDVPSMKEIMLDDEGRFDESQAYKFFAGDANEAFGAFDGQRMIGLIYGYTQTQMCREKPQFFVYSVAIHGDYRGKGIGTRFFDYVVKHFAAKGYDEVFTATDKGNVPACRVYEKAGGRSEHDDEIIYVVKL